MENENPNPSFRCHSCKTETFYDPDDYTKSQSKQLLMEMKTIGPKQKTVMINCSNRKCNAPNSITILYY